MSQLWLNAGMMAEDNLEDMDFDRIRRQFEVRATSYGRRGGRFVHFRGKECFIFVETL
jgi:hypothetical protein